MTTSTRRIAGSLTDGFLSARRPPGRVLLLLMLAGVLVGCRGDAATVAIRLPPAGEGVRDLEVVVIDQVKVVEGIQGVRGRVQEGVSAGDRPDQVILGWIGGMCDVRTTLTLTDVGGELTIRAATTTTGGGCRMAGIFRGLVLDLDHDADPTTIRFLPPAL